MISCGGSDCYTCTPLDGTGDSLEICDDPELFYTDIDGNMISFDQFLSNAEDLGFDCEN